MWRAQRLVPGLERHGLHGIQHKVKHDLFDLFGIASQPRQIVWNVDGKLNIMARGGLLNNVGDGLHERANLHRLHFGRSGAGEFEKIGHQPVEPARFFLQ